MPDGVPFSANAAHVHGDRAGGSVSDHRYSSPNARYSAELPVGDLSAQPRRTHAGDGDRVGARFPVGNLRGGSSRPAEPGDTAASGTVAGTRPAAYRTDE